MNEHTKASEFALPIDGGAHDPLEDEVRRRVRGFIETILEEELEAALGRRRYQRSAESKRGQRNGHRERQVVGTFGPETVKVPRARLVGEDGQAGEWRSKSLRRYQRLTKKAEAQGRRDLGACRDWRAARRAESAAVNPQHGRREQGGLADVSRRP